jgi:hypothetical protein
MRSGRRAASAATLAAALVLAIALLAGCGSSGGDSTTGTEAVTPSPTAPGGKAEREAPKGASPVLREIYRQFPKPQPEAGSPGSAKAIRAGERACKGKTPLEVKQKFYAAATENGTLVPNSPEGKMIAELPHFEAQSSKSSSFVAGQLAADVYEATLPPAEAGAGYQGCVYALALRLKRELAPR